MLGRCSCWLVNPCTDAAAWARALPWAHVDYMVVGRIDHVMLGANWVLEKLPTCTGQYVEPSSLTICLDVAAAGLPILVRMPLLGHEHFLWNM
ncbi:hypothetical protein Dimus_018358 [Dionaea muscipula]